MTAIELLDTHGINKNFNIRISTACIFYEGNFFGDYHQIETIVFNKKSKYIALFFMKKQWITLLDFMKN